MKYFINGNNPSKPSPANVLAIRQKTPIGANFITILVISIMTVFDSVNNLLRVSVSSFNLASINPTSTPNIITGNMSPLASEFIGLSGIMFNMVSVIVTFVVTVVLAVIFIMFSPTPGLIIMAIIKDIVIANAVVIR